MEIKHQIIKKDDKNEFAIIPYGTFLKILEMLDDYEDLLELRKAKSESVNEPSLPFEDVEKIIRNSNPDGVKYE